MARYESFNFTTLDDLRRKSEELDLSIPIADNLAVLATSAPIAQRTVSNRFSTLPMEGRDALPDGTPGDLTFRRYRRYGAGGWGIIQFEACGVWQGGRSSDRQMCLNDSTEKAIASLLGETRRAAKESMGASHSPVCLLQLQDAGRYRHASGTVPGLAVPYPLLDDRAHVPEGTKPLSDGDIESIQDYMVAAAARAEKIGFDGVDIKSCHRYLASDLLAAHLRPGKFGGGFEGRTRFIREVTERIRSAVSKEFIVASRMNIFDGFPYPYGWGCDRSDPPVPDMTEPLKLVGILKELGMNLITTSAGTPYYNPWLVRPFDRLIPGNIPAPEHPMEGVSRLFSLTETLQRAYPDFSVAGSGYTWLRQFGVYAAAANLERKAVTFAGFGRTGFAYPDLPRDVMEKGTIDHKKVCVSCSLCSEVMAQGGPTGCYAKDREVYGPLLKEHRASWNRQKEEKKA